MRWLHFCVLVFSLVQFAGTLHAEDISGKEFKTKVLEEWNSLQKKIHSARWQEEIELYSSSEAKNLKLYRVDKIRHVFRNNIGWLWSMEKVVFDQKEKSVGNEHKRIEVEIFNSKYAAQLRKNAEAGGWVLFRLTQKGKEMAELLGKELTFPWTNTGNMRLDRCLPETSFIITRLEPITGQSSNNVVRAHFKYKGSRGETADYIHSGYVDFDPVHSYRPVSYHLNFKSEVTEGTEKGNLEYEMTEGIPILKRTISEGESRSEKKGINFSKWISTYSNVHYNGSISEEEFRLSFYGLPEPQGVVWPTKTPWYLWFIAAGGLALLIGAYFRYRVRGRKNLVPQEN